MYLSDYTVISDPIPFQFVFMTEKRLTYGCMVCWDDKSFMQETPLYDVNLGTTNL